MTTIKSYTDLDQSKKLAGILPSKSADMAWYPSYAKEGYSIRMLNDAYPLDIIGEAHDEIPAWSLAELLDILPDELEDNHFLTLDKEGKEYCCCYEDANGNSFRHTFADNSIDACVEMIIKLHELNLL